MNIIFSSVCHLRDYDKVKHYAMYLIGRKICSGYFIVCQSPNWPNDYKYPYYMENDKKECFTLYTSIKGFADLDRNIVSRVINNAFILSLDSDEKLSDDLLDNWDKILGYLNRGAQVVFFKFKNLVDGVDISDILGDDWHPRLWLSGHVIWPNEAHKYPELRSEMKVFIKWPILHIRTYDDVIRTHNERINIIDPNAAQMERNFINTLKKKLGKE